MSHKTKVLAKPNMDIPVDILQKAEHLILPPSPIKKVEEILASPLRSITTVQGQLSKMKVNGTDTVIRTISIEENGKKNRCHTLAGNGGGRLENWAIFVHFTLHA